MRYGAELERQSEASRALHGACHPKLCSRRATAGTRPRASVAPRGRRTDAICARDTTSATGSLTTTSASVLARSRLLGCERRWRQRSVARPLYGGRCAPESLRQASTSRSLPTLRLWELAMLGLRLDEGARGGCDRPGPRLRAGSSGCSRRGLVEHGAGRDSPEQTRGRLLGGAVTVELLVDPAELDRR